MAFSADLRDDLLEAIPPYHDGMVCDKCGGERLQLRFCGSRTKTCAEFFFWSWRLREGHLHVTCMRCSSERLCRTTDYKRADDFESCCSCGRSEPDNLELHCGDYVCTECYNALGGDCILCNPFAGQDLDVVGDEK